MPDLKPQKQSSTVLRNARLLSILSFVPEFKNEVQSIRKEFSIDPKNFKEKLGFGPESDYISPIHQWFIERNEFYFTGDLPNGFLPENIKRPFWDRVQQLGDKFNLQYNFIHSLLYAVPYFIFTNRIVAPAKNWSIDNELRTDGKPARWFSVRLYTPLIKSEVMEGYEEAELFFNNNTSVHAPTRSSEAFIEVLDYIDILTVPKQKIETYENGYYEEMLVGNSIAEVAAEAKMSEEKLEKAWERLNNFAEKAFNYRIKPSRH